MTQIWFDQFKQNEFMVKIHPTPHIFLTLHKY